MLELASFSGAFDELSRALTTEWWALNGAALLNIIMIDLVLAGDNAIVVGLAASRVAPSSRAKVIFWGIAGAVLLRLLFSGIAQQLLSVVGLTLAGGLLLLFVAWKMYRQISGSQSVTPADAEAGIKFPAGPQNEAGFLAALWQIILADVSMSLDNVLAVAGAAKGSPLVLVVGLAIAVVLMAFASHWIARLLARWPAIAWLGLAIIVWVALDMIYTDAHKVTCKLYEIGCSETLFKSILYRLGMG